MALKAKRATVPAQNKPICPNHGVPMSFEVEELRWVCGVQGCSQIAHPKVDETGHPVIGRGTVMLVRQEDEQGNFHNFLRTSNNLMIKIDDLIRNETFTSSGRRTLSLVFDVEVTLDWRGKPIQ